MPVVVGPAAPVAPTPVVSTDGVLTATVVPSLALVAFKVRFDQVSDTAAAMTVTVTRTAGAAGNVRGLDQHAAPKGVTAGVDAECPLGVPVTYVATAKSPAGGSWTSTPVQVTVPRDRARTWMKSLTSPMLSVAVYVDKPPEWTREVALTAFKPMNRPDPVVRYGQRRFGTGQLAVHAVTAVEQSALDALLLSQGPYLVQFDQSQQPTRPDVYVAVGSDTFGQPAPDPSYRGVSFPVTQVARPSTLGSTVRLPGRSWDTLKAQYASWDAVKAANTSWLQLLTG